MDKYGTPFFANDRLTGDLYIMELNSISLITERATIMPQVGDTSQTHPLDLSQNSSPPLGTEMGLMPSIAESTQVSCPTLPDTSHPNGKWGAVGNTSLGVVSTTLSCSSGFC